MYTNSNKTIQENKNILKSIFTEHLKSKTQLVSLIILFSFLTYNQIYRV